MTIKINSTKDYGVDGVNILVYGESGNGKTRLCSTSRNPIIISAESGLLSLADFDIPAIEVTTVKEINEVYKWIISSEEAEKYETICFDSLTEVAEILLSTFKMEDKDGRKIYPRLDDEMSKTIRAFRNIKKKNKYFTARLFRHKDEYSGKIMHVPEMPGNRLLNKFPYFFDAFMTLHIGELKDGKKYRFLQTESDFQYLAKDRSGKLDLKEKPNLSFLFDKISGITQNKTKEK